MARILTTCVLLLSTAAYLASASRPETPLVASLLTLPLQLGEWHGRNDPPFDKEILDVLGVDEYILRSYTAPGEAYVGLYVGFYASQRQGDTIHSPLNCLPGAGWLPVKQDRATFDVTDRTGQSTRITTNEFVIQKGLDRLLVLYWYQSHGRVVASEYTSKVYMILDAMRLNRTDAAMARVITPIVGDTPTAEAAAQVRAREFVQSLYPSLTSVLPS